jgi:branched-subunit amino acid aminotransferase/4-amino-4-deoxychorismate lyase
MTSAAACINGSACPLLTARTVLDLARESPIVLDSWHLSDGTAVAVDRHRARFTASVRDVFGIDEAHSRAAYDHALTHLPGGGSWFPALVWTRDGLRCAIRPFPVEQLRVTATLASTPLVDRRKRPAVKGIDYLWQEAAREKNTASGYDDRPLLTSGGCVSETVFSTLVVMRDDDLMVPDAPRLPSVTLSVLRDRAAGLGYTVRCEELTMADVSAADTLLLLSALHGVRVVERLGDRVLRPDDKRCQAFRATLESGRGPVVGSASCESC